MSTLPVSWDSGKKTELTTANFFFSNKRLFRVVPSSLSLNTEDNQACTLTHITIPRRGWNKDQTRPWITSPSSSLPVEVYSVGQKSWFCHLFLVGVLEVFFLSLSPFPLSLAYFLSFTTWSATAAHPGAENLIYWGALRRNSPLHPLERLTWARLIRW